MDTKTQQILNEAVLLYKRKEQDYGQSWRLTGEIMALILQQQGEDELVIPAEPEYLSAFAVYTRRLDKIVRSFNGTFTQDDFAVDESVSETAMDQIPYAAMQTVLAEEISGMERGDRPEYENCSECGDEAAGRTKLASEDVEDYEYYCECGHVWWGN